MSTDTMIIDAGISSAVLDNPSSTNAFLSQC